MREAYNAAVGVWGIAPSEFWRLHPTEFWWLHEARRPPRMYGRMTEHEVRELYEEEYGPAPLGG